LLEIFVHLSKNVGLALKNREHPAEEESKLSPGEMHFKPDQKGFRKIFEKRAVLRCFSVFGVK